MALPGSAAGVVSGILNKGSAPKPDLTQLFATIKSAGANQRDLINALPAELKPLYEQYAATNQKAGETLTAGTNAIGDTLMQKTAANFSPDATRAALDAAKGEIYAELPGQQDAIRQALAATGGFDRGTASKQLAAPVLQAASQFATKAAGITADQLKAKQQATQQAITTIASMDSQTLQSVFGMSKEQATAILNGNRQDLKDQLTDLVNQSKNETSQLLGVQSDVAMNDYRAKVADDAQSKALTNGIVNLGADLASGGFMSGLDINSAAGSAAPAAYNPNMAPNQAARLGY
jgi:hypothetical protein